MASRVVAIKWYQRAATTAHGHYRAALRYSRLHYWFGFPTVVLATVVGTSVFATLQAKAEFWWQLTVGVMSIAAAILSALRGPPQFLRNQRPSLNLPDLAPRPSPCAI